MFSKLLTKQGAGKKGFPTPVLTGLRFKGFLSASRCKIARKHP